MQTCRLLPWTLPGHQAGCNLACNSNPIWVLAAACPGVQVGSLPSSMIAHLMAVDIELL